MGIIKNESAQFMLLAGFIIAIGLVITTVMLNNIIFESNMAGEAGGDPIKYDIVNLMRISGDEMKIAYRNATNVSGVSKGNMITNFNNQMQKFSENLSKIYALHGEGVNVSWDVNNWNNSLYANFTENGTANGATNWTVIENVKDSNIMVNISDINGAFNITLVNSTTSWINFTTKNTYSFSNSSIVGSPYSIVFINGSNAAGSFIITGHTSNGASFNRSRDYLLNTTIILSTSNKRANITIPVSVPW
ncbi:MAG: hypothetical protein O8C62_12660 [Candidatus Methanoperedens sp.]|nr:hypothetical protein [Candidatus Methanoperedens sp.]